MSWSVDQAATENRKMSVGGKVADRRRWEAGRRSSQFATFDRGEV